MLSFSGWLHRGTASPKKALLLLLTGAFLGGSLTGCQFYQDSIKLEVGNCFLADNASLLDGQPAAQVKIVDCTQYHNSEVIGVHQLDYPEYPGASEITEQARIRCSKDYTDYTGMPLDNSEWDIYPLVPTETSWNKGKERNITCVALTLPQINKSVKKQQK